jgi:hypothetical protein
MVLGTARSAHCEKDSSDVSTPRGGGLFKFVDGADECGGSIHSISGVEADSLHREHDV